MTNNKIKKLSDFGHLRLRSNMYLGSNQPHSQTIVLYDEKNVPYIEDVTWVPALYTCLREIVDNALDEINGHGHGNRIDITYDPESLTMGVSDNGRGIPIDFDPDHKQYLATMVLSEPRAGRNFDDRGEVAGVNGIGSAAVSNTSEWFRIEIVRDGKKFRQEFSEGPESATQLTISKAKITPSKSATGTKIEFKLSERVFSFRELPERFVRSRIVEIAISNPHIKISYNGELIRVKPRVEQSLFPNKKPIIIDVEGVDLKSKFFILPTQEGPEHIHSIVNNIPTFNGGVHIDTFRKFFYPNLLTALEKESKKRKLTPNRSDIQDGLFVYNITNMKAPNFDSQSKTRLINEEIATTIRKSLENDQIYRDLIRKYPDWINSIYERCAARTMKRDANELQKLNKANKRAKVESLVDATGRDRSNCVLYICEGISSAGGLINKRVANRDGVLPLTGKIMNVRGESLTTIASSEALVKIMNSIGLVPGKKAVRKELRYSKVYFTCDADEDGHSIVALLTNFAYCLWPELFDAADPYFYSFETPLVIASRGKVTKYWYADNYQEFDTTKYSGWSVRRCKGLAALNPEDWSYSLESPKLVPIYDDGELSETLDMLFNSKRADDRKRFMGM